MVVLAVEVNVDSLAAAVVGLGGDVLEIVRVERASGTASVDETIAEVVELSRRLLRDPRRRAALVGVGVAVAGVVRRSDGFVSMAPNLGWRDVPFGQRLVPALGLDVPVTIANEADLGALAEHLRGAAIGHDHVLFVTGEVGVGGGLIVDGRPLSGVAGFGGEIGHLPVNRSGRQCGCGAIGCWETEVGEGALLARAGRPADGGRDALDAVLDDADSRRARGPRRARGDRPLAGDRAGRARQPPEPGAGRPRRPVRAISIRSSRTASRRSWTATRWRPLGRSSGSSRHGWGPTPRCSARRRLPSRRSSPIRRPGCGARVVSSWPAPEERPATTTDCPAV